MAQELAHRPLIWYDKEMLEAGSTWRCDDCGVVIEGREGYDRHVSCFPDHHPRPEAVLPEIKSPVLGDAA
jgi:hypothetical protein